MLRSHKSYCGRLWYGCVDNVEPRGSTGLILSWWEWLVGTQPPLLDQPGSRAVTVCACPISQLCRRVVSGDVPQQMDVSVGSHEVPTDRQHVASWTVPCHQVLAQTMAQLYHHVVFLCNGSFRLGRCDTLEHNVGAMAPCSLSITRSLLCRASFQLYVSLAAKKTA